MAVQQNKKSPSKRGMHRAHDFLTNPPLAVEPTTGKPICAITSARTAITAAKRSSRPKVSKGCPTVPEPGAADTRLHPNP